MPAQISCIETCESRLDLALRHSIDKRNGIKLFRCNALDERVPRLPLSDNSDSNVRPMAQPRRRIKQRVDAICCAYRSYITKDELVSRQILFNVFWQGIRVRQLCITKSVGNMQKLGRVEASRPHVFRGV